jgi:hypothetical protein
MAEQVKVLCKLPAGLILEAGYTIDYLTGSFVKGPNYKRAILKGALREKLKQLRVIAPTANLLSTADFEPTITEVDEDLAREWFKKNAKGWLVRTGVVAIVEKPADAKPMLRDLESVKTSFEPINPEGDPRYKAKDITKMTFDE